MRSEKKFTHVFYDIVTLNNSFGDVSLQFMRNHTCLIALIVSQYKMEISSANLEFIDFLA